ncbi:MAG TPA: metallophosphoesterase family protein [Candidatus Angelobacter sp.]
MRLAIVSDIHGNRTALAAVLADLEQVSPDLIIHGGDLAASGSHDAEVIDQIRSLGWPGVVGNTDEMLWAPQPLAELAAKNPKLKPLVSMLQGMIPVMRASLGEERVQWLRSLPLRYANQFVTVVHASPDDCWKSPMPEATDEELESVYGPLNAPTVVYGHIHRPYIRQLKAFTVANSGSVSLAYDGDPRAKYLLMDEQDITIRRVEYDIENAVQDLRNSGLPYADWLIRVLRAGRYCPPE